MGKLENTKEIENILLNELNGFNRKIVISKILITLILVLIPTTLVINIMGIISDLTLLVSFITLIVGLIFSLRMYNYNRIFYGTHLWLLDSIINKKPLK